MRPSWVQIKPACGFLGRCPSLLQQFCYNANTLRLASLRTYPGSAQSCVVAKPDNGKLNLAYTYQSNGNIQQVTDFTRNETLSYTYDELDRLTSGGGLDNRSYTYNTTGDIIGQNNTLPNPGTEGLVSWWALDETTGTRADRHGANHLADINTVGSTTGKQGTAAQFVSTSHESLSINDNATLSLNNTNFTIAAWVKLNSKSHHSDIVIKWSDSTPEYALTYNYLADRFMFYTSPDGAAASIVVADNFGSPATGVWYFITAWYDGSNLNVSVNNGAANSISYTSGVVNGNEPFRLGDRATSQYSLDGVLDEVFLYKRSLTAGERTWLYNNGQGRTYSEINPNPRTTGLVSWWSLNETSGTRYDSQSTNHLVDNNSVTAVTGKQGNAAQIVSASSKYLSINDNNSVSMGAGTRLTVGAWVYLTSSSASTKNIIAKRSYNAGNMEYFLRYEGYTSPPQFAFYVSGTGANLYAVGSGGTIPLNTWIFVAAGYDGSNIWISVNGGPRNTLAFTQDIYNGTSPLAVGAAVDPLLGTPQFELWDGYIDEAFIYKRSLGQNELAWLYNNGQGRTYADLGLSPGSSKTYNYADPLHKHAVTSLSTGETYAYDANGNMTCRVEGGITYKQVYDVENRLTHVRKMSGGCSGTVLQTTTFVYDGDGNLVKKTNPDGTKTIYFGGIYEVNKSASGTVAGTKTYYPAGGAMRVTMGATSSVYYILKDHLGSASAITDTSGNPVGEQRYYPFGETRFTSGTMNTDKLYTGQRDTGLGIYYYNARFYSPYINHFISPDTIVPAPLSFAELKSVQLCSQ